MSEDNSLIIRIDSDQARINAERLAQALERLERQGDAASDAADELGDSTEQAGKKSAASTVQLKSLVTAMAGIVSVGKIISVADDFTQMGARIRNATKNLAEYDLVQNRIMNTANNTFRSLGEAQEVFISMSGGMKSLGYSTQQALDATDSLSYAFVMNATRADQAQSAQDALAKSMAKGKVDADAWISIVTGADNLIADMAVHTGKTEQEIRQLGATGKIALNELLETLIATAGKNEELAASMENSAKDGMQYLINQASNTIGKLNQTTAATATLAEGFKVLGDNMDSVVAVGGVAAAVYGGRLVSAYAASTVAAIAAQRSAVGLAGGMATATTAARALWVAIGGPVGLVVTIASLAAGMAYLNKKSSETKDYLDRQKKSVDELKQAYLELDRNQRTVVLAEETKQLSELQRAQESYTASLINNTTRLIVSGDVSKDVQGQLRILKQQYMDGQISATLFASSVNGLNGVSNEQKAVLIQLAQRVEDQNSKIAKQKELTDMLTASQRESNKELTEAEKKQAAYNKQLEAIQGSQFYKDIEAQNKLMKITNSLIDERKMSYQQASLAAKAMVELEIDNYKDLPKEVISMLNDRVSLEDKIKAKQQEQNEVLKEQNKLRKQGVNLSDGQKKVLDRSEKVAAKYGFSDFESQYGIPKGLLTALIAQESRGDNSAVSPTGAIGLFQTTSIYRKDMGLTREDSLDPRKAAEAASKFISAAYKTFGNWEDALTAYNAGVGGTKSLKATGKTGSSAKTKEASEYAGKVLNYYSGLNPSDKEGIDSAGSIEAFRKAQEAIAKEQADALVRANQKRKELSEAYYTEEETRAKDHASRIAEINELFAGDEFKAERKRLTAIEDEQYKAQEAYLKAKRELEITEHKLTSEEIIKAQTELRKLEIEATKDYAKETKEILTKTADEVAAYELEKHKQKQQKMLADIGDAMQYQIDMQKRNSELAGLTGFNRERKYLEFEEKDALAAYDKPKTDAETQAADFIMKGQVEEAEKIYEKLTSMEKEYQEGRNSIVAEYSKKNKDLMYEELSSTWALYSGIFGDIGNLVKTYAGESSKEYKYLIMAQEAANMTSITMSSLTAIAKAYAEGGPFPMNLMAAASMTAKTGLLQAAMRSASSLKGMAHDGIDNIPREGTWLLDKGERVLNPQQNSDLTRYLREQKESQGNQQQANSMINQRVLASLDVGLLDDWANSPQGEDALKIHFSNNLSEYRNMLQG